MTNREQTDREAIERELAKELGYSRHVSVHWAYIWDALLSREIALREARSSPFQSWPAGKVVFASEYDRMKQRAEAAESALREAREEIKKRDNCSFMGPMRDCPTHGESKELAEVRELLRRKDEAGAEFLEAAEALFNWMNGNDLSADHREQYPADFQRLCAALVNFKVILKESESSKAVLSPSPSESESAK